MMIALLSLALTLPALAQYGRPHYYNRPPSRYQSPSMPRYSNQVYYGLRLGVGLANISHDYFDTSHTGTLFATVGVNF